MKNNTKLLLVLTVILLGFNVSAQQLLQLQKHQLEVKNQHPFGIIQEEIENTPSEIITFSAPPPASNPIPENGATNVPIFETQTATGVANAVQLIWQGSDEATDYEINVGASAANLNYLGDFQGTVLNLTGITEETTYFWQIIPKNDSGSATNNPVWSFTTADMDASAAPLAPINPTPEDGASNVTLTPTVNAEGNDTQELTFSWEMPSSSEIVAQYTFKLGFDDDVDLFETTAFQSSISITGIPYGEEIFWEVIPENNQGEATGTVVWSFTTEELANEGAPLAAINPLPPDESFDVMLTEEVNEEGDEVLGLEFSWSLPADSEPVAEYEFKLGFDNQVDAFSTTLTGTSINLTGMQKGLTYFWQVIPSNSSGEAINNTIWSFTTEEVPTDEIPLAAINPTPEDSAENVAINVNETPDGDVSTSVLFEWEIPENSEFVAFIDFELSENPDMSEAFETTLLGDASTFDLSGMDYETTYYWRLTPTNSTGNAENTVVWSFTTETSMSNQDFQKIDFTHYTANNWLYINSQESFQNLNMFDLSGRLVKRLEKINTNEIKLDLNNLPNGIYITQFMINDTKQSFKFIK